MPRLIWVFGGRHFDDYDAAYGTLYDVADRGDVLITGAAPGADLLAEDIWRDMQRPYVGIPAEWQYQAKGAGPIRNRVIANGTWTPDLWTPDLAIAFPGGRGTADARHTCDERSIEVTDVA